MAVNYARHGVPIIQEDIFGWVREGNAFQVRVWLDDTEHDLNQGDDHGFSLLHWASKEGHGIVVDMLIQRGARVNARNMGDDTALHLASAHGHREIIQRLLSCKADINAVNEHGNTPLHYACFWGYEEIAEELISNGALITIANKYNDLPIDKCRPDVQKRIYDLAKDSGQDLDKKITFKDPALQLGTKTKARDATLSRYTGIPVSELQLDVRLASSHSGELWRGKWQSNDIVARILKLREVTQRMSRDFQEEYPRLRIFSHPNVCPVLGCSNTPPTLAVISQYMPYGSLYNVLHETTGIVVHNAQAIKFAIDIARGMAFLHTLDPLLERFYLSSKHVVIDEDKTAKINMADTKFSFQEKGKLFSPQWMSPETLQKRQPDINMKAADMWSFGILLWELNTREVPFSDLTPMECGMRIALEGLRIPIPPGLGKNMSRLITMCINDEPGKRPAFHQIIPILEKMQQ